MMQSDQRGFTLLEILIAISVATVVLASVYGVFATVSRTGERLESDSEAYHQARIIFDRIGRESRGAYYRSGNDTTLFRGGGDGSAAFLILSTTASTPQSGTSGGIVQVAYTLEADPDVEEGTFLLRRREAPAFVADPSRYPAARLAAGITALAFRFYHDGTWYSNWESVNEGQLPLLVEMTLTLRIDGEDVPFISSFDLPQPKGAL
ncbi:MAG: hypothetical protein C0621_02190 [Desulfuromonas sp.]|nr:MAG: hypothetical protein C0621_02190 [Desulfuromonas sp.]